jgi:hypothetical protein
MRSRLFAVSALVVLCTAIGCAEPPEPTPKAEQNASTPSADAASCTLGELTATAVAPTFEVYDSAAGVAPPAMTGGKLEGKWRVDKATIYLPTEIKAFAKPASSKGTVTSWAVFRGSAYRLSLLVNVTIDAGENGQFPFAKDARARGTFSTKESAIKFETACEEIDSETRDAEISFTEKGNRGTLVVKFKSTFGTSYLELDATRE